jgi:thiol-disulfide isomerase/thioredoxin
MIKKLLFIVLFLPLFALGQHTIKGTFSPAKDYKWAVLYKVTPTNLLYKTDAKVDEDGNFTLQLDETITKGMYRLVYAVPQDIFNFDIIYNATEDIQLSFSQEKGIEFLASKENSLLRTYETEMYSVQTEIGKMYKDGYDAVAPYFEALDELQQTFEAEAKGTIALQFIKANKPYIPKSPENIESYISNSKKNYFNYVDVNNPTLQESSFITEYAYNFIRGFVGKNEDTASAFENNIDIFQARIENSDPMFQKVQWMKLWQKFVDNDKAHTANYIAENYLIKLAKALNDEALVEDLTLFNNITIGNKAPNFSWEALENNKPALKNLHELDIAKNYIIVFWSSACSHCLKEVPLLHSKIEAMEKGAFKVIAVGLEDEPYAWRNRIRDFPEFVHVVGLGKWENEIGNDYGVNATPTYFVLDKDKKIIAKPENFEGLLEILQSIKIADK